MRNKFREIINTMLLQEINEAASALIECEQYFDPDRINDFVDAIVEQMKEKKSTYEDAKNSVFDETAVPPAGSKCCKEIKKRVEAKL